MALREGFFLLILITTWASTDARSSVNFDIMATEIGTGTPQSQSKISKAVKGNDQLCTLCENFTAQATQYIGENKTQTELLETLHQACSEMKPFEEQCILLVDFYASLFFAEISKIHPEEFCKKFDLCEEMDSINLRTSDDSCSLCHDVVAKVFIKLKDPDTQFEVIKMLLKECNEVENYVKECKKLVLQYGPLILINGEKFLENTDVCWINSGHRVLVLPRYGQWEVPVEDSDGSSRHRREEDLFINNGGFF
ncbi:Saposin-like type B, region 1 family protein [Musa troglodytarum]|uniref:Saposin-like type B, region 1 family protein n=1 Tax=Musa troglodytarum TaxID=320322 RepID=A0A9E7JHQ8_9LILI|nr:Saposin-like type B, region 1 family protein [Musa troglodytarum]